MNNPIDLGTVILYQAFNDNIKASVLYRDDTFWMTQKDMSVLFNVDRTSISRHLKNIFSDNELDEKVVCAKFAHTTHHGAMSDKTQINKVAYYNLDAIIAVGYRINSKQATQFRIWATQTLQQYIIKGYILNHDMLKNSQPFGKDYFDDLLEEIKEIRASERRMYQKVTDIFAQCSYDYNPNSNEATTFYATVQNKLHWAITGLTAAELISTRANHKHPHMGLTTWKNAPTGKILKSDVTVAKNYLNKSEIDQLNDLSNIFLDFAENRAKRQIPMSMQDWQKYLEQILSLNEYPILPNAGSISHEKAKSKAINEYTQFRIQQDKTYSSDFDKMLDSLIKRKK